MYCSMHINSLELCMPRFLFTDNGVVLVAIVPISTELRTHTQRLTRSLACSFHLFAKWISIETMAMLLFSYSSFSYQTTIKRTHCLLFPPFTVFNIVPYWVAEWKKRPKINFAQRNLLLFIPEWKSLTLKRYDN